VYYADSYLYAVLRVCIIEMLATREVEYAESNRDSPDNFWSHWSDTEFTILSDIS